MSYTTNGPRYRVYFYRTESGRCQACDYARGMDKNHQTKAKLRFSALSKFGPEVSVEHGKHLRDGVWELRIIYQHHQHRFLYMFWGHIIVVTNAFLKKSAKVPEGEIERARRAMSEWIERRGWEAI